MTIKKDDAFFARRNKARETLDDLPGNYDQDNAQDNDGRALFFDAVYEQARGDVAAVPWADCAAKQHLIDWLAANPGTGTGKSAIDIACGLGDNAEAISKAGYQTSAFDIVETAVSWAKDRFPNTLVSYQAADLFELPEEWHQNFDLVHECFTLQALPEPMVMEAMKAICDLVAKGGTLLLYTRWREEGSHAKGKHVEGPPWPLKKPALRLPEAFGLQLIEEQSFIITKGERHIPHCFSVWKKT